MNFKEKGKNKNKDFSGPVMDLLLTHKKEMSSVPFGFSLS